MNFIEFIFKLLFQFITFEPGRFAELKDKAANWRNKVFAEANDPNGQQKWYHKIIKFDNEWWFQVALAAFFLVAFKGVRAWLLDIGNPSGDDEDLNDGEDALTEQKKAAHSSSATWKF
jgi:hypothetical protein